MTTTPTPQTNALLAGDYPAHNKWIKLAMDLETELGRVTAQRDDVAEMNPGGYDYFRDQVEGAERRAYSAEQQVTELRSALEPLVKHVGVCRVSSGQWRWNNCLFNTEAEMLKQIQADIYDMLSDLEDPIVVTPEGKEHCARVDVSVEPEELNLDGEIQRIEGGRQ